MSLFRQFLNWFHGRDKLTKEQLKEVVSDLAPPKGPPQTGPQIRTLQDLRAAQEIRTLRDLKAYSDEVRKTLAIIKGTAQKLCDDHNNLRHQMQRIRDNHDILKRSINSLYVEVGNMNDKVRALAPRTPRKKVASPDSQKIEQSK